MPVLVTIVAAISTTALGLFGAILLGTGCVRWYGVSSFEGGSGYFVIFVGLIGGVAGFVVGTAVALCCLLAETRFAGWSACLVAWGVAASILLAATALSWLLAPPRPRPTATTTPATRSADPEPAPATLPDDASLDALLLALQAARPADRPTIATRITTSPDFGSLIERIVDDDPDAAARAIESMKSLAMEPAQVIHLLTIAGNDIGDRLDRAVATPIEADPDYRRAADVAVRFSAWFTVAFDLQRSRADDVRERLGPQMVRFLEASRLRPDSRVLRHDICRVASYYASQWLGLAPAAGDPPPRS
jgi:hypothetical protein